MRGLLVLTFLLAVQSRAHALESEGCDEALTQAIEAALVVELADAELEIAEVMPAARLHATCSEGSIALRAETEDGRYAGQDVPLDIAAPRRAAITLLELVRALRGTPPPAPLPREAPPERPRSLLVGSGGVTILGVPKIVLGGGALGLRLALGPLMQLAFGIEAMAGRLDVAPGSLSVALAGGSVSLRFGARAGPVMLHAGPLIAGHVVVWSGAARSPDVNARTLVGPRFSAGAAFAASFLVREDVAIDLELVLDGALASSEARFDVTPVARTRGPSFAARIGIAWVLP